MDAPTREARLRRIAEGAGVTGGQAARITRAAAEEELFAAPESHGSVLDRASAREAALAGRLSRWAADLRERVFGSPEPPFADVDEARVEWIRPATTGGLIRHDDPDGLEGDLDDLRERIAEVEDRHGVRLRDPDPVAEVLELPGPDRRATTPTEGVGTWRFPVSDARSPQYAVARAVRLFADWSGHDRGDLTAYVLAGRRPALPRATLAVRTRSAPGTSGDPEAHDHEASRRHAVLRLNHPPRDDHLRELRRELEDVWGHSRGVETEEFVRTVEDELTPDERRGSDPDAWGRVAERWGRFTGDEIGWQAAYRRYRRNATTDE